jgi:hypothetical protein
VSTALAGKMEEKSRRSKTVDGDIVSPSKCLSHLLKFCCINKVMLRGEESIKLIPILFTL